MNPDYTEYKFPKVTPLSWRTVFSDVQYKGAAVSDEAMDIVSNFLHFSPTKRLNPFEALAHPFFNELRYFDHEKYESNFF